SNCSLQGARLRDANLKNADFTGANLTNAELVGARLEGVRLKGAILTGVEVARLTIAPSALKECVLDPSQEAHARVDHIKRELDRAHDWITAGGAPAHLEGFDLRPASGAFVGRLLAGLRARETTAIAVDFSGAQLQGASFEGADLRAANFTGADLRGVSFVGANLAHAVFQDAQFGELELRPGLRLPTRFDGAILVGTTIQAPEVQSPAHPAG
ncbi:MAG: pentapeptide repeat protein, partial [Phenylobacterium sp.]|nr:pentapeptide repeat protein [Phenylobacterium sp.]